MYRRLGLLLLLLSSSSPLFGQGAQFAQPIFGPGGRPAAGATVTLCTSVGVLIQTTVDGAAGCSPTQAMFADPALTVPIAGSITASDGLGNVQFFATPSTTFYTYSVTGSTVTPTLYKWVAPCVPQGVCANAAGIAILPKASNLTQHCGQFAGATGGQQINSCILAAGSNGIADATDVTNTTWDVDIWSGAGSGGVLILPPNIVFTGVPRQIVPPGWEVRGNGGHINHAIPGAWQAGHTYFRGQQIVGTGASGHPIVEEIVVSTCASGGGGQPVWNENTSPTADGTCTWSAADLNNLGFWGVGATPGQSWVYTGVGPTTGVSIHDLNIGLNNSANWNGIVPRNVTGCQFYNLYLTSGHGTGESGIDLRDANENVVHDVHTTDVGNGAGHALGGGTNSNLAACTNCGLFTKNKFYANVVDGTTGGSDGIDISGINGLSATCKGNVIQGNTVQTANTAGIFNETCDGTSIADNTVTNAGTFGIMVNNSSSGAFICGGGGGGGLACGAMSNYVTVTGNTVTGSGSDGIRDTLSNFNTISGNGIDTPQSAGIRLVDTLSVTASANVIKDVSQSGANAASGIMLTSDAAAPSLNNTVSANVIVDTTAKMHFGMEYVCTACVAVGGEFSSGNMTKGGAAGSLGSAAGVQVGAGIGASSVTSFDKYCTAGNACTNATIQNN